MKSKRDYNIQIIDGASNCTYSVFSATKEEFKALFPADGQDIEYGEDFFDRVGATEADRILKALWAYPVHKPTIRGLHGTLFFGLTARKTYFPSKRECETDPSAINDAQRALYQSLKSDDS